MNGRPFRHGIPKKEEVGEDNQRMESASSIPISLPVIRIDSSIY